VAALELGAGDEADAVPGAAAEVSGAALVLVGFAPLRTGNTVETHLALDVVGCGTPVLPDAVVRTWLACSLPEATAATVGLPLLLACVPFPSVPALPRGEPPPPPLSESLA